MAAKNFEVILQQSNLTRTFNPSSKMSLSLETNVHASASGRVLSASIGKSLNAVTSSLQNCPTPSASASSTRTIKTSRPRVASAVRKAIQVCAGQSLADTLAELKKSHRTSSNYTDAELLRKIRNELSNGVKKASLEASRPSVAQAANAEEVEDLILFDDEDDEEPIQVIIEEPGALTYEDESSTACAVNHQVIIEDASAAVVEFDVQEEPAVLNENVAEDIHINIVKEFEASTPGAQLPLHLESPYLIIHNRALEFENAKLLEALSSALAQIEESNKTIAKMSSKFQRKITKKMNAKLAEINGSELLITVVQPPEEHSREIAKIFAYGISLIIVYYLLFCA